MLQELSIRNFALIDDLHISFSEGLTVLSGETGAGKSMIVNAVNLLLGSRVSSKMIRTGAKSAELEALFRIEPNSHNALVLETHGVECTEELVIRRIISGNDRHRIFINGRIATIQLLTAVTESLASISGQHEHQNLLKEDQHLLILDQFAGLLPHRESVCRSFHEMLPLIRNLNDLLARKELQAERTALVEFQKQEITRAAVSPGEDNVLENERLRLKNSQTLYQAVHQSIEELYGAEGAVIGQLVSLARRLEKAGSLDAELANHAKKITDIGFQVEDVTQELKSYLSRLEMDERRLDGIEERLDLLHKLKRKYGGSLEAVLKHLDSINAELFKLENLADMIEEVENKISDFYRRLTASAESLSESRKKAAVSLAKKVEQELSTLKMPETKFSIFIEPIIAEKQTDVRQRIGDVAIQESGIDRATFMIATNVGEQVKPLASIASGGELSRVVLALKAILAVSESTETLIFDEVDAGIGGGVAEVIGRKLADLAKYHQVICITHLPQIAKFADHHLRISKHVSSGRTTTAILPLDRQQRVEEIARMLGGEKITRTTRQHAMEMLDSR